MTHIRLLQVISIPLASGLLAGCAGSGPDLRGPEGPNIMAAYSGDWVLDPAESDNLDGQMREAMRRAGSGGPGGLMGSGGSGSRGGGGRPGGGGGMAGGRGGGGMDPEAGRSAMEAIRELSQVPEEFSLALRPETVGLTPSTGAAFLMSLGAEKEKTFLSGATVMETARWTKNGIEIKREIELGGGVEDRLALDDQGNLILKREVQFRGGAAKGILVYRRK